MRKTTRVSIVSGVLLGLLPLSTFAQAAGGGAKADLFTEENLLLGMIGVLMVAILLASLAVLRSMMVLKDYMTRQRIAQLPADERARVLEKQKGFWASLTQKLTDSVPVEKEELVMTDHEYDGIIELDNSLPPWWVALFWGTIAFSVIYMAVYHVFGWGQLQDEEYRSELVEAQIQIDAFMATKGDMINAENVEMVTDEALLAEGKVIYDGKCVACHGAELQGGVGPNLVDEYWIHGGSIGDVFKVIHDGVPSKGMISWKAQLSSTEIQNVASYIISMEGTEPPNPKEPQGEPYER